MSTLFSVIVPLEFHRDGSARCVDGWVRQSLDALLYEIILVVPPDFDRVELAELQSRLRPHDQVRLSPERHDMSLLVDGVEGAQGELLFFTESHVWPEPDVLEKCMAVFDEHSDWAAFSCCSLRVTGNRLSEVEADMYEADIRFAMEEHPWRKILDQCFVTRREQYILSGGLDPGLGHFAEWVLAAEYYCRGYKIGNAPHVRLEHKYVGELKELRTFTRDFIDGEFRFLSRSPGDAAANLIESPVEWDCRGNWDRRSAAVLCRLTAIRLIGSQVPSRRTAASLMFRWLSILIVGSSAARVAASLDEYRRLVAVGLSSRLASKQRLNNAFRAYISAIIHARRMKCVAASLKRQAAESASPPTVSSSHEWHPLVSGTFELAGFHPTERSAGAIFRWSEPAAMIGVRLPAGVYEVFIELLDFKRLFPVAPLELFHNQRRLPAEQISLRSDIIRFPIHVPLSGHSCLAWRCGQVRAPFDPRRLGLPVTKITWCLIHEQTARDHIPMTENPDNSPKFALSHLELRKGAGDETPSGEAAARAESPIGSKMTTDQIQSPPTSIQARIDELSARIAVLERAAAESSKRGNPRRLLAKLRPNLWTFEQYAPRVLAPPRAIARERLRHGTGEGSELPIAIVTPSFNQGHFIDFTIQSVLSQEYSSLSYRVQDGGSTDSTLNSLRRHEAAVSWESAPDRGQAHAINVGFSNGTAEIMGYLNSDDILLPGALAYVGAFFRHHPEVDIVYSHRVFIDRFGMEVGRAILPRHDPVTIKWADYIPQETMFWRRKVWDMIGPIDENYQYAMDWDFILRAQANGFRFHRVPTFLGAFRVHDFQKTTTIRERGDIEQMRLREIHLGFVPTYDDIKDAIRPYLRRHVLHTRLYKLKLLKC